jgi:hypothetical protein
MARNYLLYAIAAAISAVLVVVAPRILVLIGVLFLIRLILSRLGGHNGEKSQALSKTSLTLQEQLVVIEPRLKTSPVRRCRAYRISNIPISVTKDVFRRAQVEFSTDENLIGFSYSVAVASTLCSKYCVATARFIDTPDIDELQRYLHISLGKHASMLRIDADFFGLTPLHSPAKVQDITVELVLCFCV